MSEFPAACLLSPAAHEAMLLRQAIHAGIRSGPAIADDAVFAQLNARYAEPAAARKPVGKRKA
jgi:hypothetical protein